MISQIGSDYNLFRKMNKSKSSANIAKGALSLPGKLKLQKDKSEEQEKSLNSTPRSHNTPREKFNRKKIVKNQLSMTREEKRKLKLENRQKEKSREKERWMNDQTCERICDVVNNSVEFHHEKHQNLQTFLQDQHFYFQVTFQKMHGSQSNIYKANDTQIEKLNVDGLDLPTQDISFHYIKIKHEVDKNNNINKIGILNQYCCDKYLPEMHLQALNLNTNTNALIHRKITLNNQKYAKILQIRDKIQLQGGFDHINSMQPSSIFTKNLKLEIQQFDEIMWVKILGRIDHIFASLKHHQILIGMGRHGTDYLNEFTLIDLNQKNFWRIWREEVKDIMPTSGCVSQSSEKQLFIQGGYIGFKMKILKSDFKKQAYTQDPKLQQVNGHIYNYHGKCLLMPSEHNPLLSTMKIGN